MVILVTGAAGFIGFHLTKILLKQGCQVIGVDSINDYYDTNLKQARLNQLQKHDNFHFFKYDIADQEAVRSLFKRFSDIEIIIHLAAQAGVRFSLENPYAYIHANIDGHLNILEQARCLSHLKHLIFASSSSVYGLNQTLPFKEEDAVNMPSSVYAASKRSAELLSFTYSHIYGLRQTGLRLFTVYGPWGRPDMAYFKFAKAIMSGKPIEIYEGDGLARDFTYIDDVIDAILCIMKNIPDAGTSQIFNIGNNRSESVRYLIQLLEGQLGKKAILHFKPRPVTDLEKTWASIDAIHAKTGWTPKTDLSEGIGAFVEWFKAYI